MKKIILLLIVILQISSAVNAQLLERGDKIVVQGNFIYSCQKLSAEKKWVFCRQDIDSSMHYSPILYLFGSNYVVLKGQYLCWEVVDRFLVQNCILHSNNGPNYALQRYFDIEMVERSGLDGLNKKPSLESLLDFSVPPYDVHAYKLFDSENKSDYKFFIDFTCTRDSFLFYTYIQPEHKLEKWVFYPFASRLGFRSLSEREAKEPRWEKIATYKADFQGPFRAVSNGKKSYLVAYTGQVYEITGGRLVPVAVIPDMADQYLVVNKDLGQLQYIPKTAVDTDDGTIWREKLNKSAVNVVKLE